MKSIRLSIVLFIVTSSFLHTVPHTPFTKSVALLAEYNDKLHQAVASIIQCMQTNSLCDQQILTKARTINGIMGAALITLEIQNARTLQKNKGKGSK